MKLFDSAHLTQAVCFAGMQIPQLNAHDWYEIALLGIGLIHTLYNWFKKKK